MRLALLPVILSGLFAVAGGVWSASAQALPTSSRVLDPAVFAGVTAVETGLGSGRNVSLTAGIDLDLPARHGLEPALEYRGTYAIDQGHVDSLKSNLLGLKVSTELKRFNPYADLLVGRGETTYANGGFQVPNKPVFYTESASNVFSFGGGLDVFVSGHLAVKFDVQAQRYSSPVTASGSVISENGTIGVVYAFRLGHRRR